MNRLRLRIILIIICLLPLLTSCDPPLPLEVQNQTDQSIAIYVGGHHFFDVLPHGTTKSNTLAMIYSKYFVEAINENGDIIYSRAFGFDDLRKNKNTIIITTTEENPYLPLEIQNRTSYELIIDVDFAMIGVLEPGLSMKKRPLPNNFDNYTIRASAYPKTVTNGKTYITQKEIYKQTLNRAEIETSNWKIIIESH
jgi:hypothetical protein